MCTRPRGALRHLDHGAVYGSSDGAIINPRRACAARVTVVLGLSSLCVCLKNLTNRPTNDTTYLTGNEDQINCAVFSENAPLQS